MASVSDVTVEDVSANDIALSEPPQYYPEHLTTTIHPKTTIPTRKQQPPNTVLTTIYDFPRMEPLFFTYYANSHLAMPLRKDLLHRAVIYEGDKTRQGTASTKWRDEVRGSHRKIIPQKGTGRARAGDKQSPIRRGGGAAFGPKPRDFATGLPRKMYDIAWRTALSYRYRRGELVIVDRLRAPEVRQGWWMKEIFEQNGWGKANARSLLVALYQNKPLATAMEHAGEQGKFTSVDDVDVKDLLGMGRIIVERSALNEIIKRHSSDLMPSIAPLLADPATEKTHLPSATV